MRENALKKIWAKGEAVVNGWLSIPSGFSAELGVFRGDVILNLNQQPMKSVDDFTKIQSQLKSGSDVLFLIARRTPQRTFSTLYLADRLP